MDCEATSSERKGIIEEIESYSHAQTLLAINRDGDKYYVECPSCNSTSLNKNTLLSCKTCHTHFQPYYEDGLISYNVDTESNGINGSMGEIKILEVKPDAYFKQILLGRNDYPEHLEKLREKYPDMKVIKLSKDLQPDGKDAHGHEKYKRYALIPLD